MGHARFEKDGSAALMFSVNPSYPGDMRIDSGTVTATTEGGDVYSARKAAPAAVYSLRFEGMPASDYDVGYDYSSGTQEEGTQSLVNWFLNIAPPASSAFTYTDPFGVSHAVTFADGALDMRLTDEGEYSGTVRLRKALQPI